MIERTLLQKLENRIDYKKALILLGPRQTGKTTLAKALAAKLHQPFEYFNGDSSVTRSLWSVDNIEALQQSFGSKRIVILDEATAHLDSENEALVQEALKIALKDRTSIVIAHRLSTVVQADQILVLENGLIAERGTHEQLVAKQGLYFDLFQRQSLTTGA